MHFPNSPLRLPSDGFSIWTRSVTDQIAPSPAKYHLLGQAFTIWTRPQPTVKPVPTVVEKFSGLAPAAPATNWGARAAWLALPAVVCLWYFDHDHQSKAAQDQITEAKSRAENGQHLQGELSALTKSLTEKSALLADLETKSQTMTKERDGAKEALTSALETLKKATATAGTQTT